MADHRGDRVLVGTVEVRGLDLDGETRCAHYAGERDVVAIEFACCRAVYPCFRCHDALADHEREVWPQADRDRAAILCGACGGRLSIGTYLEVLAGEYDAPGAVDCPHCEGSFNPGCRDHLDRYFDV